MTLQEHAQAIGNAIRAAFDDGFELDNADGIPVHEMDLNVVADGTLRDWVSIDLPEPTYH